LEEIPGWRLEVDSFKHIVPGMEKTYARGYHGLAKAGKKSKDENLHEWRKRAKYLRYHFKILDRLWPAMLDTLEDELHDITDYLGMAHDLEILEQTILDERIPFKNDESATLFFALLHEQKNALQKRALMRGQKVFVDDPDEFVRKMGLYWKLHKQKLENAAAS
jgi:CHAD domain-containing protein